MCGSRRQQALPNRAPLARAVFEDASALHVGEQTPAIVIGKVGIHGLDKLILGDPDLVDAAALSEATQDVEYSHLFCGQTLVSLSELRKPCCGDRKWDVVTDEVSERSNSRRRIRCFVSRTRRK